jgi:hypothetical protein
MFDVAGFRIKVTVTASILVVGPFGAQRPGSIKPYSIASCAHIADDLNCKPSLHPLIFWLSIGHPCRRGCSVCRASLLPLSRTIRVATMAQKLSMS